jgi:hypothetical protein
MRVIVCGSRGWTDAGPIYDRLHQLAPGTTVVHGGAKGPDTMAGRIAMALGLPVEVHPAKWDAHGRRAGIIRNEHMAALGADLCLAFWDGRSRGTANMIGTAQARNIPTEIVSPE